MADFSGNKMFSDCPQHSCLAPPLLQTVHSQYLLQLLESFILHVRTRNGLSQNGYGWNRSNVAGIGSLHFRHLLRVHTFVVLPSPQNKSLLPLWIETFANNSPAQLSLQNYLCSSSATTRLSTNKEPLGLWYKPKQDQQHTSHTRGLSCSTGVLDRICSLAQMAMAATVVCNPCRTQSFHQQCIIFDNICMRSSPRLSTRRSHFRSLWRNVRNCARLS